MYTYTHTHIQTQTHTHKHTHTHTHTHKQSRTYIHTYMCMARMMCRVYFSYIKCRSRWRFFDASVLFFLFLTHLYCCASVFLCLLCDDACMRLSLSVYASLSVCVCALLTISGDRGRRRRRFGDMDHINIFVCVCVCVVCNMYIIHMHNIRRSRGGAAAADSAMWITWTSLR